MPIMDRRDEIRGVHKRIIANGRIAKMSFQTHSALAATLAAAVALIAPQAASAQETIRFAHVDNEGDFLNNPYWVYTQVFDSLLSAQTGGRYALQVFPNSQLGDLESLAEQNVRGSIEMVGGLNAGHLAAYYPPAQVLELPYTFPTLEVAREVLDGPFGAQLSDSIAEGAGVRVLDYLPSAFRNFSNSVRPIRTPADMEGLKIRTQSVPIHLAMVEALGASATPIAWGELYNALQTGVVDGQENAPYTMLLANLQEVQSYYTLDHHLVNMPLITINEVFWEGLSPEDQEAFAYAGREASFAMLGVITAKEAQDMRVITDAGVEIYQPTPEEFQSFVDKVQGPVAEQFADKIGADLIADLNAAIADAQSQ